MNRTQIGILAIVGVAAGSFAYWLYTSMTPAERKKLEDKAIKAGNALLDTFKDLERTANKSITDIKHTIVDS